MRIHLTSVLVDDQTIQLQDVHSGLAEETQLSTFSVSIHQALYVGHRHAPRLSNPAHLYLGGRRGKCAGRDR